jgi:hypothetical protein
MVPPIGQRSTCGTVNIRNIFRDATRRFADALRA